MRIFRKKHRKRRIPARVWLVILCLIAIFAGISVIVTRVYSEKLQAVSSSAKSQVVTIAPGSSVKQIGDLLEKKGLIQSSWALQLYVDTLNSSKTLQAGTYALAPDETTQAIVSTLTSGIIQTNLVTILPGIRIDQVRNDLINYGYSPTEVDSALNPSNYSTLPVAAFMPKGTTTLEGMLWPDSFERTTTTPLSTIITESLNEMASHLTSTVQSEFAAQGLTTYQGITLASIVNQEVNKPNDQTQVAQIFLSRIKSGAELQSDVTAFYGAIEAGQSPSVNYSSAYNTYQHTGLPPTPISTISLSSLNAVTHPANTSWLYFVTGDDGTTYYSDTLAQQQSNTANYCHKLCSNN
jgi:UPF0755 protein